jgi:torulene dioxygenase
MAERAGGKSLTYVPTISTMLILIQFDGDVDYRSPVELVVTGQIPAYAAGILYRTGPGGCQVVTEKGTTFTASHWFDGFAQVHRFEIIAPSKPSAQTKVFYNSRKTVDKLIENIRKSGSFKGFTFGQKHDPCESYFKKFTSMFTPREADANVNVTFSIDLPGLPSTKSSKKEGGGHASGIQTLWVKTDATVLKRLDPETLEPIGMAQQTNLHPDLKGAMSAAHAKSDPVTGDVYNFNLDVGRKPTYRVFHVSASTGETEILATITNAKSAYIHSLFLTENHVVLCVWGSYYAYGGAKLLWEQNILDALNPLDESIPSTWFVVDRKHGTGVVATYESTPFFCFHTINAWEEPSTTDSSKTDIVADLVAYDNCDILKKLYYNNVKATSTGSRDFVGKKGDSARPAIKRWRLPNIEAKLESGMGKAILEWAAPKSSSVELPTMNFRNITRPYRYIYGVSDTGASTFFDQITKYDTHTHKNITWQYHGQTPGEPIFVPDPKGNEEDEGVLLSVVLDGTKGKSYLLVLDARNLQEVGRASMESVVAFGFHGNHIKSGDGRLDY